MAFPVVNGAGYSEEIVDTTTHDVVVPTGIVSGELLLLLIVLDGIPTLSGMPSGWTQLIRQAVDTSLVSEVWYRTANATEANFTYTSSASERSVNRCLRIGSWHGTTIPEAAAATGIDGANPDPPNLDPAGWGTEDTLWVAFCGNDDPVSAYPTSYTDNQFTDNTGTTFSDANIAMATRNLAAAAEDPGTFTQSPVGNWVGITVAVRPAAAAAPAENYPVMWALFRRR